MQVTNGNLYWKKKSNIKNTYAYLTEDIKCDVLVIGGGITGAITAYLLSKEGANVVIVEKNIVGYAATAASSGILECAMDADMCKLQKVIGEGTSKRIYKLCENAIKLLENINSNFKIDTGFKRQDFLYFANKFMQKASMLKELAIRKDAGFDAEFIESSKVLNLSSGVISKNACAVMDPYLFLQALFDYLDKLKNIRIFENTDITNIDTSTDCVLCKTNNNFKITADSTIFCTGAEALKYIKNAPVELSRVFSIVTKPIYKLKNMDISFVAKDSVSPCHYMRSDNGRIILSGENIKLSEKMSDKKYLSSLSNEKYKKLYSLLKKNINNIEDISVEYAYNSIHINTKDNLPIIDEMPNMPNCFCNLSFGSNGIVYGTIGADMLKNAIKGFYTKDMNIFKINR
ncbi:MAG: FAD-dependent oxidoreductase [Clostridia bacterium]